MHVITVNYIAKWRLKFKPNRIRVHSYAHEFLSKPNRIRVHSYAHELYIIDKKFYSVKYLRNELELIPKQILPF